MSGKPILHILKDAQEAWRKECPAPNDKYLPPGLVYYIKEIILDPNEDEDTLEANLADLIIELLGRNHSRFEFQYPNDNSDHRSKMHIYFYSNQNYTMSHVFRIFFLGSEIS